MSSSSSPDWLRSSPPAATKTRIRNENLTAPAAAALLLAGTGLRLPVCSAGAGTDPADRRNRHGQRHRRRTGLRSDLQGDGRRPRRPARHRQTTTQPDGHRLHRHPQHVVRLPRHSRWGSRRPPVLNDHAPDHGGGVRDDPRRRPPPAFARRARPRSRSRTPSRSTAARWPRSPTAR